MNTEEIEYNITKLPTHQLRSLIISIKNEIIFREEDEKN